MAVTIKAQIESVILLNWMAAPRNSTLYLFFEFVFPPAREWRSFKIM